MFVNVYVSSRSSSAFLFNGFRDCPQRTHCCLSATDGPSLGNAVYHNHIERENRRAEPGKRTPGSHGAQGWTLGPPRWELAAFGDMTMFSSFQSFLMFRDFPAVLILTHKPMLSASTCTELGH